MSKQFHDKDLKKVRRALSEPAVPEAVRRLPEIMRAAANSSRVDIAAHIDDEAEASAYSAGYQFAARYFADELDRAIAQHSEPENGDDS